MTRRLETVRSIAVPFSIDQNPLSYFIVKQLSIEIYALSPDLKTSYSKQSRDGALLANV